MEKDFQSNRLMDGKSLADKCLNNSSIKLIVFIEEKKWISISNISEQKL